MKQNLKSCYNMNRIGMDRHLVYEDYFKNILSTTVNIKNDMSRFMYHIHMDTEDVSKFFPIDSDATLAAFMNRSDNKWDGRKKGFYHLLFNAVTVKKNRLACALLHLLFTRTFISEHSWPNPGTTVSQPDTVNPAFISFLKATLGKMVGCKILDREAINLEFWETWPRKFYNIRTYDVTKVNFFIHK